MTKSICWEIADSPYNSEGLQKTRTYTSGKHSICVIDQFSGKRPFLLDENLASELQLNLIPTMILDSQIASALHKYRTCPAKTPKSQVNSAIKLLWHLVRTNWDYNPLFYCFESASKASNYNEYLGGVTPTILSIMELQLINEKKFLYENIVQIDDRKEEAFIKEKGVSSLLEAAEARAEYFWNESQKVGYKTQLESSYAVLLKIVLINKRSQKAPYQKIEELLTFMLEELGCFMAREYHLAFHYFVKLLPRMIIVEQNIDFDQAKKNLLASTWDIFLLRLPEYFLSQSNVDEVIIGYVCTAEKELQKLGSLFNIKRIMLRNDGKRISPELAHTFMPQVRNALGLPPETDFEKFNFELLTRVHRTADKRKAIPAQQLQKLIKNLEVELKTFCKSNTGKSRQY